MGGASYTLHRNNAAALSYNESWRSVIFGFCHPVSKLLGGKHKWPTEK